VIDLRGTAIRCSHSRLTRDKKSIKILSRLYIGIRRFIHHKALRDSRMCC
jgi:hypothetical protein